MLSAAVSQGSAWLRLGTLVLLPTGQRPGFSSLRRALPRRLLQHSFLGEPELQAAPDLLSVPRALASCHTALVDGYIVEGHVPADDVKRLLSERPDVAGISVPGMPIGLTRDGRSEPAALRRAGVRRRRIRHALRLALAVTPVWSAELKTNVREQASGFAVLRAASAWLRDGHEAREFLEPGSKNT